jgi:hypothetical protein
MPSDPTSKPQHSTSPKNKKDLGTTQQHSHALTHESSFIWLILVIFSASLTFINRDLVVKMLTAIHVTN